MAALNTERQQLEQRMAQHKVVLCLQDTTELNYNGQAITGLVSRHVQIVG